jgi:polar amino acid transport system substrate-binding protein
MMKTRALVCAVFVAALLCLPVAQAHAFQQANVTLNEETGGQPTRFTFNIVADQDASTDSLKFTFPEGFDLSKIRIQAVLLEGLRRTDVKPEVRVEGETLELGLTPAMPAGGKILLEVYDVGTTVEGGKHTIQVAYPAEKGGVEQQRVAKIGFSYKTPSRSERVSRYLAGQAWVKQYNKVKFLSIFLRPQLIAVAVPALFTGWLWSMALVAMAFPIAIMGGLLFAFMKMADFAPLRWIAAAYINVIRGTPLFLQIFIAFIGLRIAGIRAPDAVTAVLVLALNSSAYLAEIFRAGIQSIHRGQFEAASSLGMTYWQAMLHVIIPQTVKRVLPTMTSEFILLFKDTSLLAAVGIFELMMYGQNMVSRSANLTPFMVAAAYYLIVTVPLINWVGRLERKLAIAEGGHSDAETTERRKWLRWRGVQVTDADTASGPGGDR